MIAYPSLQARVDAFDHIDTTERLTKDCPAAHTHRGVGGHREGRGSPASLATASLARPTP